MHHGKTAQPKLHMDCDALPNTHPLQDEPNDMTTVTDMTAAASMMDSRLVLGERTNYNNTHKITTTNTANRSTPQPLNKKVFFVR